MSFADKIWLLILKFENDTINVKAMLTFTTGAIL